MEHGTENNRNAARISIESIVDGKRIDDHIFGHFLESAFFQNIEGGVFDEGSALSDSGDTPLNGCRLDVIEACRELGLPIVRWPGGNFTSPYRWMDGVGPRDERPRTLELAWGSEESNRFGTAEFLAWCDAVGTTPYLGHSGRSVDDAVRWVEYTNYAGDTTMTRQRKADGIPEPRPVKYWGIGNEVWGPWQMGQRSAAQYVIDAREHARFMRLVDGDIKLIAVGWEKESWLEEVVPALGGIIDYFSIHLYGVSLHRMQPTEAEFDRIVAQPMYFEQTLQDASEVISRLLAENHITRRVGIAMDEWNIRHLEPASWPEPLPGDDGGVAPREIEAPDAPTAASGVQVNRYSQRTLADALFYAGVFHVLHRTSQLDVPVTMANTVNLVNANGLISVRPNGLVRAATFHVWDLYQNRMGRRPVDVRLDSPASTVELRLGAEILRASGAARTRPAMMSYLDVTATLSDDDRFLQIAVINRSARDAITAQLGLGGISASQATMSQIGAGVDDLFAWNSFDAPDTISLSAPITVDISAGTHEFPAHSITLLEIAL
ncbi:alpha-L-arabinofuranosidase C-terminal domain-containing protein [Microbacterium sp. A94]|uniref:alpha-L-arabinofuranosidase C-terminal domain-containing protein n=1 Tax=Microbacterium sp. A94 TaxID=3450717 RepID=UPI003F441ED8